MRINRIAMVLLFLMGIYILAASGTVLCANLVEMAPDQVLETMKDCLVKEAAANIYSGMVVYSGGKRAGRNIFEMVCRNGTSDASSDAAAGRNPGKRRIGKSGNL